MKQPTKSTIRNNAIKLLGILSSLPEKSVNLHSVAEATAGKGVTRKDFSIEECGSVCCIAGAAAAHPRKFPRYKLVKERASSWNRETISYSIWDTKNKCRIFYDSLSQTLLGEEHRELFEPFRSVDIDESFFKNKGSNLGLDGAQISDRTLAIARLYHVIMPEASFMTKLKLARTHESRT